MAWEARGKRRFYYRKVRSRADGQSVRSVYLGRDSVGEAAAALDDVRRSRREDDRRALQAALDRIAEAEALCGATAELTELVADAALLAAGFHKRRHQWRRKRHGTRAAV